MNEYVTPIQELRKLFIDELEERNFYLKKEITILKIVLKIIKNSNFNMFYFNQNIVSR